MEGHRQEPRVRRPVPGQVLAEEPAHAVPGKKKLFSACREIHTSDAIFMIVICLNLRFEVGSGVQDSGRYF